MLPRFLASVSIHSLVIIAIHGIIGECMHALRRSLAIKSFAFNTVLVLEHSQQARQIADTLIGRRIVDHINTMHKARTTILPRLGDSRWITCLLLKFERRRHMCTDGSDIRGTLICSFLHDQSVSHIL
jgi:hypothetical protein